jgi:hypothetical protein
MQEMKVNKDLAGLLLERIRGGKKDPSKVRRQKDKLAVAGKEDMGSVPEDTVLDIIYDIPSVKISNGNITLPPGKTVEGEENLRRYLGDLGMALAWHEPEVMPYSEKLDLLFDIHDDAARNFADQYQYAADEVRVQEDMDDAWRQQEGNMIRIKRSELTKAVHQILSEDRIGGVLASAASNAVSQQMQDIQKEREELAEKMKTAIASQDDRAVENIQNRLKELDTAAASLADAQADATSALTSDLTPETVPSDADTSEYTTIETEGKIRRSELRALIREAEKELSDLKPIGQMSDEELKAKYHPEDTLADAVHHALGPWLRDMGFSGGEADWGVIKDVMDGLRSTLTPAADGSRGPSAEERRLTQQILAGSFHKRIQDMAMGVLRDRGWIE